MLEFQHVSVQYERSHPVLRDISFSLTPGITVLIGQNGAGKSSLLHTVTGEVAYAGEIRLQKNALARIPAQRRAQLVSLLPQHLPAPALSVFEVVSLGFSPHLVRLGEKERQTVWDILQKLQITHLAQRPVSSLSGGERQKVFLGMLLAQNTPIWLLDEPTTYMDAAFSREFAQILQEQKALGKSILLVMHDLNDALSLADRILLLQDGGIAFDGTPQQCSEHEIPERVFGLSRYEARANDGTAVYFYKA